MQHIYKFPAVCAVCGKKTSDEEIVLNPRIDEILKHARYVWEKQQAGEEISPLDAVLVGVSSAVPTDYSIHRMDKVEEGEAVTQFTCHPCGLEHDPSYRPPPKPEDGENT